jgi:hypothetical protein
MKSFTVKPPTFGMKSPKAGGFGKGGFSKGKLKMPSVASAPAKSGARAAKGFGSGVSSGSMTRAAGFGAAPKSFGAPEPGGEILQTMHTSKHH